MLKPEQVDANIWGILSNEINHKRYEILMAQDTPGPILEIGCHWGYLATLLAEKHKVTAIDIDTEYLKVAKEVARINDVNINFVQADANALPFKSRSFGTVFLCEILEHLDNPVPVVREAARVAEQYLYITTPAKGIMPPETTRAHKQDFELDDLIGMAKGLHNGLWAGRDEIFNYLLLRM